MTYSELKIERRHVYETRLGILGITGYPTADQHNMAVIEADAHVAAIKRQDKQAAKAALQKIAAGL